MKLKRPLKLKGMTIMENIIAFAIIMGVLALAFVGLTVSADYVQRGRDITEASDYAEKIMETVTTELENYIAANPDKTRDDIIDWEKNRISKNTDITQFGTDTVILSAGEMKIGNVKAKGIYVAVKVRIGKDEPLRYSSYGEFVPYGKA